MHRATQLAAAICLLAAISYVVPARPAEPLPAPLHVRSTIVESPRNYGTVERNFGTVELPPVETRPAATVRAYDDVYSPPIGWYGYGYAYAGYPYYYGFPYGRVGVYGAFRGFYRPGLGLGYVYAPRSFYPSVPYYGGWYDGELNRAAADAELLDRDPSALSVSPYVGGYAPQLGADVPPAAPPRALSPLPNSHRLFYW